MVLLLSVHEPSVFHREFRIRGLVVLFFPRGTNVPPEPVADSTNGRSEGDRSGEVIHFGLDQAELRNKQPLNAILRSTSWAHRTPIERVPLPPVLHYEAPPG